MIVGEYMKKILILFLSIILIPINVFAETCNAEGVTIQSIEMLEKAAGAAELSAAKANGTVIDLDISFTRVDDYINYKITIENNTDGDYVLDESMFNKKYTNVKYLFETDNMIVKAGSTRDLTLSVSLINDPGVGKFNETNSFDLDLTGGKISNPSTGVKSLLYILPVLLIVAFVVVYSSKKNKTFKAMMLTLALVILIPTIVKAVCKCNIKINSTITVENCKYKLVTDRSSFDEDSNVREICLGSNEVVASEKLTCSAFRIVQAAQSASFMAKKGFSNYNAYLTIYRISRNNDEPLLGDNSYIKVYSDNQLIKTIRKEDIPPHYYFMEHGYYYDDNFIIPLGRYEDIYVEPSMDLRNKIGYDVDYERPDNYIESDCSEGDIVVTSSDAIDKIATLKSQETYYDLYGFSNCKNSSGKYVAKPGSRSDLSFRNAKPYNSDIHYDVVSPLSVEETPVCEGDTYHAIWYINK